MSITTYAELKTAIADFLDRDDLAAQAGTFIALAEARIARDLRHWKMEKRVTTDVDERYENLPFDWLRIKSISHTDGALITPISESEMGGLRARSSTAGKPTSMRISADQIEFYPVPDQSYEITMTYTARIHPLSDADYRNWLLIDAPDILLYGALMQSAPYLGEDARVSVWGSLYQSGVEALNTESESSVVSGPISMRIPR